MKRVPLFQGKASAQPLTAPRSQISRRAVAMRGAVRISPARFHSNRSIRTTQTSNTMMATNEITTVTSFSKTDFGGQSLAVGAGLGPPVVPLA
jgi:hypothetical protein